LVRREELIEMSASNAAISPVPEPPNEPPTSAQVERAARALIGWMKPDDAERVLLSNRGDVTPEKEHREAVRIARDAVAARSEGVDQTDLVTPRPMQLDAHIEALKGNPAAAAMLAEGWDVALVDLRRVCGFQPVVFSDQAVERVRGIDADDLAAIAGVALPVSSNVELPIQFDQVRQAWMVSSANPNLRIAGPAGPIQTPQQVPVLGFGVTVSASFVQVVRYRNRYFLRDGYHRAYGFLSRGIAVVPAFVREMTAFEEMVPDPRLMLPQDSYRGPRPPVLVDYVDDTVSAAVRVPAAHKMVVVQALELQPIG